MDSPTAWTLMFDLLRQGLGDVISWLSNHYVFYTSPSGTIFQISWLAVDISLFIITALISLFLWFNSSDTDDD